MCIYTYLELLFLCLLFLELVFDVKQVKRIVFVIGSISLILLIGLRSNTVGADTVNYVKMFSGENGVYGTMDHPEEEIEHGIYYIAWIIRLFSDEYWAWHLSTSIITLFPFLYFVKKYSYVKAIPFFMFLAINWHFLYLNLTVMRQNLSVAFFLMAVIVYLRFGNEKKILLLLLFLISFFIHRSIIIAIAIFFMLQYVKFDKKIIVAILFLSILAGILVERTLYDVVQLVNVISDTSATERFAEYDKNNFTSSVNFNRLGPATIYVVILTLCSKKENFKDLRFRFLITGCVFYNLSASINIAMRLVYPLTFLGITYVPVSICKKENILYRFAIIMIMLFFFYANIKKYNGKDDYDNTYPYTFVWE